MATVKLVFLMLLCAALSGNAASLCVSAASSGAADGSDWNNALGASFTPVRGNTYYLADGSYGSKTLSASQSGTTLITIQKATTTSHVTETGWVSTMGDGQSSFAQVQFTTGYWVFDGVTGGGPNAWKSSLGFEVNGNSSSDAILLTGSISNITIRHVDAHVYPDFTPEASMGDGVTGAGFFQVLKGTAGGLADITVSRCYFHHAFGCLIHMLNWKVFTVEYSWLSNNRSTAGWHGGGLCVLASDSGTVRFNTFQDIDGTAFIDGIGYGTMTNWTVYGNVFMHTGTNDSGVSLAIGAAWDASNGIDAKDWKVLNNDIINVNGVVAMYWASPTITGIVAYNNVWYQNRQSDAFVNYVWFGGNSYDYNYYSACASAGFFTPGANENAFAAGPNCPLSVATADPFAGWAAGNFALSGPIATGAGMDTTSLLSANGTDMFGNTRGGDGTWDRGAIEYPPLVAPSGPSSVRGGRQDIGGRIDIR